jgi:hypothetical protein
MDSKLSPLEQFDLNGGYLHPPTVGAYVSNISVEEQIYYQSSTSKVQIL